MKSCLGILLVFFTFVAVLGGGAFLWYISSSSEFSRTGNSTETALPAPKAPITAPKTVPKANSVR